MAISSYSSSPSSNTTISGINIAEGCPPSGINDAIRQLMADVKGQGLDLYQTRGADVASAATLSLAAVTGDYVYVTGTTGITAITLADGRVCTTKFAGALTITNGASLICPGNVNYSTAANDVLIWRGEASGVVRCVGVMKADGTAPVAPTSFSDNTFTIADNTDPTKLMRFLADNVVTGTTAVYTMPSASTSLIGTTTTDTLTNKDLSAATNNIGVSAIRTSGTLPSAIGANITPYTGIGTIASGTVTPAPQTHGPMPNYTNNGAHTLAPPANPCSMIVEITNAASAGAITTSGYTKVTGDAFTTTNGHKFLCTIVKSQTYSLLNVVALQ